MQSVRALLLFAAFGYGAADVNGQEPSASGSAETETADVTFASRGWARHSGVERFGVHYDDVYFNAEHGLFVMVPEGWTVGDEAKIPAMVLWAMARTDESGDPRSMVGVIAQPFDGSGEVFFRASLDLLQSDSLIVQGAKQPKYQIEYADRMKGSIGVWEIDVTDSSGHSSQRLYMARDGFGYMIGFQAFADASSEEKAELQALRRAMGF